MITVGFRQRPVQTLYITNAIYLLWVIFKYISSQKENQTRYFIQCSEDFKLLFVQEKYSLSRNYKLIEISHEDLYKEDAFCNMVKNTLSNTLWVDKTIL